MSKSVIRVVNDKNRRRGEVAAGPPACPPDKQTGATKPNIGGEI